MCGRFYVAEDAENELLAAMIREASRKKQALTGTDGVAVGEVTPGCDAAALALGKSGAEGVFPMRWGFTRPDGKGLVINTRSETALDRPLFRDSMLRRRCLLPISWYFEWERAGDRKLKYAIRPQAGGQMYLAGLYRYEEGQPLPVFSVLTQVPAPEIAFIHDRMPVIFSQEDRALWLNREADPRQALAACQRRMAFRPAEDQQLRFI